MKKMFLDIARAAPVGVLAICGEGIIRFANPALCKIFGYDALALIGQPIDMLLPEAKREGHRVLRDGFFQEPASRGMGDGRSLFGQHAQGWPIAVEIGLAPITYEDQSGALAVVTDISVRKKLEQALVQANINLEEFAYIASHDLRSPLRGIADLLEWIEEDIPPAAMTEPLIKNFARAKHRLAHSERMIENLLIYACSNKQHSWTQTINLRELVAELLAFTQAPPGFTIETDVPELSFVTSKTPLLSGLRNLLDNALKHHGGSAGKIKLTVREEGRFLVFSVDDDGAGVPANAREKIFKLFHRASDAADGHGIGLAVTRRMIDSHGGELILDKNSPLGGACFNIYWPRFEMNEIT